MYSQVHTFFEMLSPCSWASCSADIRELAYSMRSLIDEPDGQVYTKMTTSESG